MRVSTAFKRLMDLPGVTVSDVEFQPAGVVVMVKLSSRKLHCPACGFTTKARYDTRPVSSTWRHVDLGRWRLDVGADLRRISCPVHGVRTEGFPSPGADPGSPVTSETWSGGWRPAWTRRRCAGWCASTGTPSGGSSAG